MLAMKACNQQTYHSHPERHNGEWILKISGLPAIRRSSLHLVLAPLQRQSLAAHPRQLLSPEASRADKRSQAGASVCANGRRYHLTRYRPRIKVIAISSW